MRIKNRNASKSWTTKQEKKAQLTWLSLTLRSLIIGKSENAIMHRVYKLSKKEVAKKIEQPKDYLEAKEI